MKKIFCVLICFCVIVLSGCGEKGGKITPVTSNIQFTAKIDCINGSYTYKVKIDKEQNTQLKIENKELKGMSYYFSGDTVTEKFNKLEHEMNLSSLPDGVIIDFIYSVFTTIKSKNPSVSLENGEFILTEENERYKFKMYLGETGIPLKIEDKENGITAIISDAVIV